MTATQDSVPEAIDNPTGCPITHLTELLVPTAPPGWHFDNFDAKREQAPVHTGIGGEHQFWLVTRAEDIRTSFQQPTIFSNQAISPAEPNPQYRWIPEMLEGKIHTTWRHLTGPYFAPGAVEALLPKLRQRFGEVLDSVADRGSCDFVRDVALLFPNVVFMDMMGLPLSDADRFLQWEVDILHLEFQTTAGKQRQLEAMMAVVGYFSELIALRRSDPHDDIISASLSWVVDGELLPDQDILDFCLLMFMAGLDTVAAQMTYNTWHLARHDEDRRRIVADPSLQPKAIEEFLRFYSFVTPGRKILQDTEIAGCPVKAGHMVYMPLTSANRDPREFPDADRVIIDRADNRHVAFGIGPHRCLGSNLARAELKVAMEMWHERIPDYRIADGTEITEHGGQIGIDSLPLVWEV